LRVTTTSLGRSELVVHVDDLLKAFRLGVSDFIEETVANPSRAAKVFEKSNKFFASLPGDIVNSYLKLKNLK
jgi:hypothetical protein